MTDTTPFYVADWLVEPGTGRLSRSQQEVKLEPRVMDLLVCLASRPGEVMTRDELESTVWAGMVVGYDSLSSAIIKLRKAFEDNSRNPQIIETVPKRGYRLIAAVTSLQNTAEIPEVTSTAEDTEAEAVVTSDTNKQSTPPWRKRNKLGITILALAIVTGIVLLLRSTPTEMEHSYQLKMPNEKASLVVLPFANSNNNKEQEYFSDGITDDLINDLSQYSGLNVIARRSAYIYKQRHSDIQTIAHELGVTYVVDGDVRRDGNKLRLNVQLIDASTGVNIWAQRFDRETKDIFAVQDDIRKNIISALSLSLTAEERNRERVRYTSSFEAYDLFLQGQAKLVSRASAADSRQAHTLMERAIKVDPNFARAYAALAYTLVDMYRLAWARDLEKTRHDALAAGKKAIELDQNLQQAYWVMGNIYLFMYEDFDKAIEMAERAVALAPNDNDGLLTLAVIYAYGDNPDKAILICQDIMKRSSSYSSLVPAVLGLAYFVKGNYPQALAANNKSLEINPTYLHANVHKIAILYRMGRKDDALFQVDELYNLHPNFNVHEWAARLPFKDKSIIKTEVADLINAGIQTK